jgi:hypothetical protein
LIRRSKEADLALLGWQGEIQSGRTLIRPMIGGVGREVLSTDKTECRNLVLSLRCQRIIGQEIKPLNSIGSESGL